MSIVRIGLAETERFAEGYDAIFGKKKASKPKKASKTQASKPRKKTAKKSKK